jgi:SAM-dependent methyltransferase
MNQEADGLHSIGEGGSLKKTEMDQYDYDGYARYYDVMEFKKEYHDVLNGTVDRILRDHRARKVHDISCGTGCQLLFLSDKGYALSGSDLSKGMIDVARGKLKDRGVDLYNGDMRTDRFGEFDAVISIFNSVGHLSTTDLIKALINVKENLVEGGIFIFDILNLDYFRAGHSIDHEFIDTARTIDSTRFVRFNRYSVDLNNGMMRSRQRTYIQESLDPPVVLDHDWDLRIYSSDDLKRILQSCGYSKTSFFSIDGSDLDPMESISVLTVAQR